LERISTLSAENQEENDLFRDFLKEGDNEEIDQKVGLLNQVISPKIDCTQCGNCCKSLLITVTNSEANLLSNHLKISLETFQAQFLEKGIHNMHVINQIPCHFLHENKCTVYEHRFEGCREFPGLHLPNFKKRLFTTFMHYERCPIVFNVVEQLKVDMLFKKLA
jgi:Fe-S-cluster containining protein